MPACRRCGSRSVKIVFNPLTFVAHVLSHDRRTRCPRCGWTGWVHKMEWAHVVGAGIWRGAGGIQGNNHERQSNSIQSMSNTPADTVFEKIVAEERGAPDLDDVDRALAEYERTRAERRDNRQTTSPSRTERHPRKTSGR